MGEQTNTKRGRPSDYKPEYCQQLIDYMSANGDLVTKPFAYEGDVIDHPLGYLPNFFEGFATKIGVCRDTLDEWKKKTSRIFRRL